LKANIVFSLVELIVLNIGLQARILDARTFSMFVVHAIVLTFITTPLTLLFYPPKHRFGVIRGGGRSSEPDPESQEKSAPVVESDIKTKFALVLDKVEQLPPAMTLSHLLIPDDEAVISSGSTETPLKGEEASAFGTGSASRAVTIDALRLIELTNRTSAVIKSQEAEALIYNDPVISTYSTFGTLNRLSVSASLSVVGYDQFPESIAQHVTNSGSEMVLIPWARGTTSVLSAEGDEVTHHLHNRNPFDHRSTTTTQDQTGSAVYSEFIRQVFLRSPKDVALFVDRGVSIGTASARGRQHLFLPFFGGPDDRLALTFLVQLASRSSVKATVVRIQRTDTVDKESVTDHKGAIVEPGSTVPHLNAVRDLLFLVLFQSR
jgi:hypothetical protein